MDTTNRSHSNLPARNVPAESRLPAQYSPMAFGGGGIPGPTTPTVNPRAFLRVLTRHWWHILGLSIIVSLPALYVIYIAVAPKYEAAGLLRVEPSQPDLYSASTVDGDRSYAQNYLRTQLNLINSKEVLEKVATSPQVKHLPLIRDSEDYFYDLDKALTVEAIKDTFLIRVALESKSADEAFAIVQAVINTYMDKVKQYGRSTNKVQMTRLQSEASKIEVEIKKARDDLFEHTKKGNIQLVSKASTGDDGKPGEEPDQEFRGDQVSEDDYSKFRVEYIRIKVQLAAQEKILKKRQEEAERAKDPEAAVDPDQTLAETELARQIVLEFRADPEVRELLSEIDKKEKEISRVGKIARRGTDPALGWLRNAHVDLEKQYKALWDAKYDAIRQHVLSRNPAAAGSGEGESPGETLKELEQKVADLRASKDTLERQLNDLQIENKEARIDALKAEIAKKELDSLRHTKIQIDNRLKQASYEAEAEPVRVSIADEVQRPLSPSQNRRIKLMAVTPIAIMFGFLGLFLLLEIKAERVFDPDALSTRVHSEVFALPPLPSAREVRKMRELENGSDQIDRFIQRLDHLRFAVCGSQAPLDTGRCVLITSAVGGEGKTTLAAQLAARCGNAGMSTLLIDADMRRASLGSLLDVADGPGLSDVLKGELTVEEGAVPVQGGAFHLLPAGTPIDNISHALHGPNIGSLIARLRQLYDLVVIDSPPVLPVPDALILGQWVDGAILASRFDVSRFPQVERARRQLDNAGITVLGTVINGMRASDSYYGHYSYTRKKGTEPNPSNAH
jgi:capsular exopolysaccharide synthesis family protein